MISKRLTNFGCGSLLAIAFVVVVASSLGILPKTKYQQFIDLEKPTYSDLSHDAGMACTMAAKLIKPQLKAPSSAEFDYADCKSSATHSGNTWTLTTYVDSDNSFGAHIRTHFVAKMTNVPPSDQWRLDSAVFDNP